MQQTRSRKCKKWTKLLISNNDSSDNNSTYASENDRENGRETFQEEENENEESSKDMSYEEDDLFSGDDYDGFAFVQDVVSCNINGKAGNP